MDGDYGSLTYAHPSDKQFGAAMDTALKDSVFANDPRLDTIKQEIDTMDVNNDGTDDLISGNPRAGSLDQGSIAIKYGPLAAEAVARATALLCPQLGHSAAYSLTSITYFPEASSNMALPPHEVV